MAIIQQRENVASVGPPAHNATPARWTLQSHPWMERWKSEHRGPLQRKKLYVLMFVFMYLLLYLLIYVVIHIEMYDLMYILIYIEMYDLILF